MTIDSKSEAEMWLDNWLHAQKNDPRFVDPLSGDVLDEEFFWGGVWEDFIGQLDIRLMVELVLEKEDPGGFLQDHLEQAVHDEFYSFFPEFSKRLNKQMEINEEVLEKKAIVQADKEYEKRLERKEQKGGLGFFTNEELKEELAKRLW